MVLKMYFKSYKIVNDSPAVWLVSVNGPFSKKGAVCSTFCILQISHLSNACVT